MKFVGPLEFKLVTPIPEPITGMSKFLQVSVCISMKTPESHCCGPQFVP